MCVLFCDFVCVCVRKEAEAGITKKLDHLVSQTDKKDYKRIFKNVNYLWAIGLLKAFFNALNIFYNKCLIL